MASTIDKIKSDIVKALNASQKKTSAYDTEAEVVRIEGNTAWVHIAGGVSETPVALTINAEKGDKVQVRVSNEGAWLMGNATSPPTDDKKANEADAKAVEAKYIAVDAVEAAVKADVAAQDAVASAETARTAAQQAQEDAEDAQASAASAQTSASNALTAAQSAQTSADSALVSLSTVEDVVGVLNWITAHGTMTANGSTALDPSKVYFVRDNSGDYHVGSYYYSIVAEPKAEDRTSYYTLSIDESVQNYVATHVVVDTEGLWLIPDSGGNKVLIATGAGSSYTTAGTYIIGKVSGVDTVFAKFTTDGVTMNATNSTQIAHLGYGVGTAQSGTATSPYYTLGLRLNNSTVGNYSVAEGRNTTASGYCSHAEGGPSGSPNDGPVASGESSHAEGSGTLSSGKMAHAEGRYTEANGLASHAQNDGTIANGESQTVLGKYNVADTTSAVIIGNGTANNARSNALTVDWSGNVNIASGAKYKINGTNLSASDVSAVALSDKYTRSSAGDLNWSSTTEGDAKVIAKSALAFWNGAYSGNSSNLSKCSKGNIIGSNGGTMTGQLLTSYRSSVAMGSYGSAQTTVDGLAGEVRFSSGCSGSASIGTAYTKDGVTIPTGWYNFMYMPHRSGGKNGSADGDNANYGNLFLFGMNNANGRFIVRVSSSAVTEVVKIITTKEQQRGSIASTSVSANSYKDVSVTFSPSMASAPIVVCSLVSTSTAGAIGSISAAAINVSTTGFTVRIFNAGSSAREPAVNWIAMV